MILISHKSSADFVRFLEDLSIPYIFTADNPNLDQRIADHPDLSLFRLDDGRIVVDNNLYDYYNELLPDLDIIAGEAAALEYPYDSIYNVYMGSDFYIHNDITEKNIKAYMDEKGYKHLFVKQGYSRCSIVPMSDRILTSDFGIYKALKNKLDVLLLEEEIIPLDGFDKGFLGGTCGMIDENTLVFNGDITKLKSYELIKASANEKNICLLYPTCDLLDTGSILKLY